ncbi:CYTH domain-containing protein [Candidatus Peribacteria bacterium]|nr:CYTH domain-containing protein [Candidatus Peribacteria bacterium]
MMVEVERQFRYPDAETLEKLRQACTFITQKQNHDGYYQHPEGDNAQKDWWLRQRNGSWQLKYMTPYGQYTEFHGPKAIAEKLALTGAPEEDAAFEAFLLSQGYWKLVEYTVERETLRQGPLTIELERILYADPQYNLAMMEVEMEVPEAEVALAEQTIEDAATQFGLIRLESFGKATHYIKAVHPEVYAIMLAHGVIRAA